MTDANTYSPLPSSCHPSHIVKNIPYNLAYRMLRICSDKENLVKRLGELTNLFITREYREKKHGWCNFKGTEDFKIRSHPKSRKQKNERPGFILTFNPALPSFSHSLQNHWRVMISDPYLIEVFRKPPMVAFRRTQNLRSKLIKAKPHQIGKKENSWA